MDTVQEIEAAIAKLSPDEFRELMSRLEEHREAAWDRQMEEDAKNGNLDKLWERAERENAAGETISLEEFLRNASPPR